MRDLDSFNHCIPGRSVPEIDEEEVRAEARRIAAEFADEIERLIAEKTDGPGWPE